MIGRRCRRWRLAELARSAPSIQAEVLTGVAEIETGEED
jgi:hypothetical protein